MSKPRSWQSPSGRIRVLSLVAGLAGLLGSLVPGCSLPVFKHKQPAQTATQTSAQTPEQVQQRVAETYGKLPLSFEANQGQVDGQVKFLARGRGYALYLTADEAVLALRQGQSKAESRAETKTGFAIHEHSGSTPAEETTQAVVRMKLLGSNTASEAGGLEELPGKVNYFIGNDPEKWRTDIPTYAKVRYAGIYPGVDLVYYGNQGQLEYDLVVSPSADPNQIKLAFEGADVLETDQAGDLILKTDGGALHLKKPLVYQEVNGAKQLIAAQYVLHGQDRVAGIQVGVQVAAYDVSKPLIIDPVLIYSTYLGGSGGEWGFAIAVDGAGSAYVAGHTGSPNFPTASPLQGTLGGSTDAFVAKLNAEGSALVYSTYLGGSGDESAGPEGVIAVDGAGNAYVTGSTTSSDFPTASPLQGTLNGPSDAFVTKLNAAGSALVYSTYLGGSDGDWANGIALDASSSAYVTGTTGFDFPLAGTPAQSSPGNAFVAKLNAEGSALVYSTYLGSGDVMPWGIAVDGSGNAYVTGDTSSVGFPTVSPLDGTLSGLNDAFVTKLNAAGSALVYSTYLGGSGIEHSYGIAVDASGNAYVAGGTDSADLPTMNPYQSANAGGEDVFVSKLNAAGSALVYSTYLGGGGMEHADAIAVDGAGNACEPLEVLGDERLRLVLRDAELAGERERALAVDGAEVDRLGARAHLRGHHFDRFPHCKPCTGNLRWKGSRGRWRRLRGEARCLGFGPGLLHVPGRQRRRTHRLDCGRWRRKRVCDRYHRFDQLSHGRPLAGGQWRRLGCLRRQDLSRSARYGHAEYV
jgi:hypothetical protein